MPNNYFYSKKPITCQTGEKVKGYKAYLKTKHWKEKRIEVAEQQNYTCARCQGTFRNNFNIHHNSYKNLGKEKPFDLTFYCVKCHKILHKKRKSAKENNNVEIVSELAKGLDDEQLEKVYKYILKISKE